VAGSVGPVTAQQLQALGPPYNAQSVVGQTGLELAYQKQLAGRPGATVTAVGAAGATVGTVAAIRPRPGRGSPLPTDAWLIGFNNTVSASDIAFAMVTVDGGEGGPTDGPIVARFLDLLHQSGV
jgi:cell division protein FtsI/penicillin-binding protein 2